ncbi:Uncharacterized protein Adt_18484 [Abeliophyllum distichum]|uniref:Uncharacterized protein n=1 Tax=Abeliophyllum distichum TaxID=126358 RepID=A0ABD1TJI3_9LAMI
MMLLSTLVYRGALGRVLWRINRGLYDPLLCTEELWAVYKDAYFKGREVGFGGRSIEGKEVGTIEEDEVGTGRRIVEGREDGTIEGGEVGTGRRTVEGREGETVEGGEVGNGGGRVEVRNVGGREVGTVGGRKSENA